METDKVLTIAAMSIAGLVALIFVLDAAFAILDRNIPLDVLFILAAALVIWQGYETNKELR